MKSLGQIAFEADSSLNGLRYSSIDKSSAETWERIAETVATEAVRREQAAADAVKARVLAEMQDPIVQTIAGPMPRSRSEEIRRNVESLRSGPTADIAGVLEKMKDEGTVLRPIDEAFFKPPEPSLLEVALAIYQREGGTPVSWSDLVKDAAQLIAAVREHEKKCGEA